jgi:hypothetical protein
LTTIYETKLEIVKETVDRTIQEWLKIREELLNQKENNDIKVEFHDRTLIMTRSKALYFYNE